MTIQDIKEKIETKTIDNSLIIFKCADLENFIVYQYIHEIATIFNKSITYIEQADLEEKCFDTIGNMIEAPEISVVKIEEFSINNTILRSLKNIIVICNKITQDSYNLFYTNLVEVPELEAWQIKDYTYSMADGVDKNLLDNLVKVCDNNLYRLDLELSKIAIFDKTERDELFKSMLKDGTFSDLIKSDVFELTNALLKKDKQSIYRLLKNKDIKALNVMGIISILYSSLRNIINIQLQQNPTAVSCGISDKQFWAIKKYQVGILTKKELLKRFEFITSLDYKIKSGLIMEEDILDYIIMNFLN